MKLDPNSPAPKWWVKISRSARYMIGALLIMDPHSKIFSLSHLDFDIIKEFLGLGIIGLTTCDIFFGVSDGGGTPPGSLQSSQKQTYMKKLGIFLILILGFGMIAFAQDSTIVDSTGTGGSGGGSVVDWIKNHLVIIVPIAIYIIDGLLRFIPSAKNWSILALISKLLNAIPNKRSEAAGGGTFNK